MYLTKVADFSRFSSFCSARTNGTKKPSPPSSTNTRELDLIAASFDESMLSRLQALNPPCLTFSWFTSLIDFLSFAHTEAKTLISNVNLDGGDESVFGWYLDGSVKVLDLCTNFSSEIARFTNRCLYLKLAISLLCEEDRSAEKIRRCTEILSTEAKGFDASSRSKFIEGIDSLIAGLVVALGKPPKTKKITSTEKFVRRTVNAVGLLTLFVAGALSSALRGKPVMARVRAPEEYSWSAVFNGLESAIWAELNERTSDESTKKRKKKSSIFAEAEEVETRGCHVCDMIRKKVGSDSEKEKEEAGFNGAVTELERATEAYAKGVEELEKRVKGLFSTVLGIRNAMMEIYKESHWKKAATIA